MSFARACSSSTRDLGLGSVIVEFPEGVIQRAALPGAAGALLDPRVEQGAAQSLAVRPLGKWTGDRPHRRAVVPDEVLEARRSDARGRFGDVPLTAPLGLGKERAQDVIGLGVARQPRR